MRKIKPVGKIIIPSGVVPEKHEVETASLLAISGHDVVFIIPSRTKGVKNPDILYRNKKWELKCPVGNGRWTIKEQLRRAAKQSSNVILDSRRTKISSYEVKKQASFYFSKHKSIKEFILITKSGKLIEYQK